MIIADTGFWVALANRRDRHHELAKARLSELAEPLVSTWPVVTETCKWPNQNAVSQRQRVRCISPARHREKVEYLRALIVTQAPHASIL